MNKQQQKLNYKIDVWKVHSGNLKLVSGSIQLIKTMHELRRQQTPDQ